MTASEMGKIGAAISNANRSFEQRSKAAKKGWRTIRAKKALVI